MIEVNLLPGATRRTRRSGGGAKRGLPFALPSFAGKGLPQVDRWLAFIVAGWILGPAIGGWMFLSVRGQKAELALSVEEAVQDSVRYAALISTNAALQARRDTIAQKLQIIQEIDAGRYLWAHVLDEVSRALPEYTWLTAMNQSDIGPPIRIHIAGQAGNTFALAEFMKRLEESSFLSGVRLTSSLLVPDGDKLVYDFLLEATQEEPPPDMIQTVPLFAADMDTED